jgi:hypothetical protein
MATIPAVYEHKAGRTSDRKAEVSDRRDVPTGTLERGKQRLSRLFHRPVRSGTREPWSDTRRWGVYYPKGVLWYLGSHAQTSSAETESPEWPVKSQHLDADMSTSLTSEDQFEK